MLHLSSLGTGRGRGVRVVVIDSGVHAGHPHVGGVAGGVGVNSEGEEDGDFLDRLGHGTAVTAAIREKAPEAEIHVVKVFDRELATTAVALQAGIMWAVRRRARLVNLSLGTRNPAHEPALADAVAAARDAGIVLVAAGEQDGVRWLPGALPGVVAVQLDWTLPRDACRVTLTDAGAIEMRASGFPRPIPGVPPERNLKGLSFAVANATGLLACWLEGVPADTAIAAALREYAERHPSSTKPVAAGH